MAVLTPASEPQPESPTNFFNDDGHEVVEREWRGADVSHIHLAQSGRSRTRSGIFSATVKALVAAEHELEVEGKRRCSDSLMTDLCLFEGWGGLYQSIRPDLRKNMTDYSLKMALSELDMTQTEFSRLLQDNRLESYYTPPELCQSMWSALEKAGVSASSNILEAGCGSGRFFVTAPDSFKSYANMVGIEADPFAARIAKVLVPDAQIINNRFEGTYLERNGFSAVIGNVPFGETLITDSRFGSKQHLIHDYFLLRSLEHLETNGIMAVITSKGTMDKANSSVRKQMVAQADLIAGVRLPLQAFASQDTNVVTDILVFQKRPAGTKPSFDYSEVVTKHFDAPFLNKRAKEDAEEKAKKGEPLTELEQRLLNGEDVNVTIRATVNRFFDEHPQFVLGTEKAVSSAFGGEYTVSGEIGKHIDESRQLNYELINSELLSQVDEGIVNKTSWEAEVNADVKTGVNWSFEPAKADELTLDTYDGFVGDYIIHNDALYSVTDRKGKYENAVAVGYEYVILPAELSKRAESVIRSYIPLRDAARRLVTAQMEGSDEVLAEAQSTTRELYDSFVKKHGPVNQRKNGLILNADVGYSEVIALELYDDEKKQVIELADTFTKRVIGSLASTKINSAEDAYYHSINKKGAIDFDLMSEVSGIDSDELKKSLLGNLVFVDPKNNEYVQRDIYLSGNVVEKLRIAQDAAERDSSFRSNVFHLEEVRPAPIAFHEISLRLGAHWIPVEEVHAFVENLFNKEIQPAEFSITRNETTGEWSVDVHTRFRSDHSAQFSLDYGTESCLFNNLLEMTLNGKMPTHRYPKVKGERGTPPIDTERTMESRAKQEQIQQRFLAWITNSDERVERFENLYNNTVNVIALPEVSGDHITFDGLNATWVPRKHQSDYVALMLQGKNSMAAHCVGAGKTFEMVAGAMKLKQVGLVTKPMIAVPNHMLNQMAFEGKDLFPAAKVLIVENADLNKNNREAFFAKARNNDWDFIVCTHSMLDRLKAPYRIRMELIEDRIAVVTEQLNTENKRRARSLEAKLKSLQSELVALSVEQNDIEQSASIVTLEDLGVDSLFVDEAHLYKNLNLDSSKQVLGIPQNGSKRAQNLKELSEYMREIHGKYFGLNFFTATPISNSLPELYVHNNLLRPDLLGELGIKRFDDWAASFGEEVTKAEVLPEGKGVGLRTRFSRFTNLPELIKIFRTFADVKNRSDIKLPTPKVEHIVKIVEQTPLQKLHMEHLAIRASNIRKGNVDPKVDNILNVSTDGRKSGIDLQLVDPIIPIDEAGNKAQQVADDVFEIYRQTEDVNGTQLIFCDMGTPKTDGRFSVYEKLRDLLVEKGMRKEEFAFIHEAKNDDQKERIFSKVRSGEIRVLMGSTSKMGVGTNVQERLAALHHFDVPWRPADFEQRDGRIIRQGNKFFDEVKVLRYITKDSYEVSMYEKVNRKQEFIEQAMSDPDSVSRVMEEDTEIDYSEIMAAATGEPKIREHFEIGAKVDALLSSKQTFETELFRRRSKARETRSFISGVENHMKDVHSIMEDIPKARLQHAVVDGVSAFQAGPTSWLCRRTIGQIVKERLKKAQVHVQSSNEQVPMGIKVGSFELKADRTGGGYVVAKFKSTNPSKEAHLNKAVALNNVTTIYSSDSDQRAGNQVMRLYETYKSVDDLKLEHKQLSEQLRIIETGFEGNPEWPHSEELELAQQRKRELDQWFVSQDFDQMADKEDQFAMYLERLNSDMEQNRSTNMQDTTDDLFVLNEQATGNLPIEDSFDDEENQSYGLSM